MSMFLIREYPFFYLLNIRCEAAASYQRERVLVAGCCEFLLDLVEYDAGD